MKIMFMLLSIALLGVISNLAKADREDVEVPIFGHRPSRDAPADAGSNHRQIPEYMLPFIEYAIEREAGISWHNMVQPFSAVGQLVRRSESIVEARVVDRRPRVLQPPTDDERGKRPSVWLQVKIENVLWGEGLEAGEIVEIEVFYLKLPPEIGFSGWMFLTRRPLLIHERSAWGPLTRGRDAVQDWDVEAVPHWVLVSGTRGAIAGNDAMFRELRRSIEGFIAWYVRRDLAPLEMGTMLTDMRKSTHKRLRDDAFFDVGRFYRSLSTAEQDDLLSQEELSPWIRETFNQYRENARQHAVRAEAHFRNQGKKFVAHLEETGFAEAIASGDQEQFSKALSVLGHYGPPVLKLYEDLWAPHLRAVLGQDDDDLKWRAASHLSKIQCPDAVPVIMNRLRNLESDYPRATLADLKLATGQNFPFDPEASEEVREAQIKVWEEWWEREGREKLTRLQRERNEAAAATRDK